MKPWFVMFILAIFVAGAYIGAQTVLLFPDPARETSVWKMVTFGLFSILWAYLAHEEARK